MPVFWTYPSLQGCGVFDRQLATVKEREPLARLMLAGQPETGYQGKC